MRRPLGPSGKRGGYKGHVGGGDGVLGFIRFRV